MSIVDSEFLRDVGKRSIAVVDEESIGAVEAAGIQIEITIVINVGESCTRTPESLVLKSGWAGDVFESEVAAVFVKTIAPLGSRQIKIKQTVVVVIAHADAAAGKRIVERVLPILGWCPDMHEVDASAIGGQALEAAFARGRAVPAGCL